MYCRGDCRRLILSFFASRSRSRWRIFSRSGQERHRQGQYRRHGGDPGKHHRHEAGILNRVDEELQHWRLRSRS
jgi:hypothetical protein